MTMTRTVKIPANRRRLTIDIPREIPAGDVIIAFTPVPAKRVENNGKIRFTRKELDEMVKNSPTLHKISGILSHLGDVDLDEVRMARLAKHL